MPEALKFNQRERGLVKYHLRHKCGLNCFAWLTGKCAITPDGILKCHRENEDDRNYHAAVDEMAENLADAIKGEEANP